jgi:2-(1,2-epoxy-1,2-dihydrophenyl)acetyl-CoA isomerase
MPDGTSMPLVLEARNDGVATLTLNRPDCLNALDSTLGHALVESLHRAAEDSQVRAVVVTGAGRGFCAGGDLNVLRAARETGDEGEVERLLQIGKQIILAIASMPKPVLAAVNGPAAGAGVSLALVCDLCLASDRATFTQSFLKIGLFPDFGSTFLLPRLVGPTLAARLFYTGDTITADEAARAGMITCVLPNDAITEQAAQWAQRLAAAPPIVVRGLKHEIFGANRAALEHALDEEIRWQMVCFRSEDSLEGLRAFFEKRPPQFRGR